MMGIVAYAFWREGPLTAFAMCVNVLLAGLLAFNFWEPIADLLDPAFSDTFLGHRGRPGADARSSCRSLMLLRWIDQQPGQHAHGVSAGPVPRRRRGLRPADGLPAVRLPGLRHPDAAACSAISSGSSRTKPGRIAEPLRKVLPPDVVWLAMMHRLSGAGLSAGTIASTAMQLRAALRPLSPLRSMTRASRRRCRITARWTHEKRVRPGPTGDAPPRMGQGLLGEAQRRVRQNPRLTATARQERVDLLRDALRPRGERQVAAAGQGDPAAIRRCPSPGPPGSSPRPAGRARPPCTSAGTRIAVQPAA